MADAEVVGGKNLQSFAECKAEQILRGISAAIRSVPKGTAQPARAQKLKKQKIFELVNSQP